MGVSIVLFAAWFDYLVRTRIYSKTMVPFVALH